MFRNIGFRQKIMALVATALAGFLILSIVALLRAEGLTIDARRGELTTAVQSATSIANAYRERAAAGEMTAEEAKQAAAEAIRLSRYGGTDGKSEYFHVWTSDGKAVMHPTHPEWTGQSMLGKLLDTDGNDSLKALIDAAVRNPGSGGFAPATFPKPGHTEPVPKLQYAIHVPGWNWVVGSGVYMDDLDALVRTERIRTAGVAAALLLAVAFIGFLVARSVLRQIGGEPAEAMRVMGEVARGNLTAELKPGAPGSLLDSLQSMVANLRRTIGQIHGSTDSIRTAADEIADGNLDLSQRTEETASNLQQTAASLEQITGTVRQTADSARTANQLASTASASAATGGQVVEEVVAMMEQINESSRRIADIIGTIDGIAFQTNILALNAAVEAARAGEQGRGFAVVASEVRSLAQRSADAAREIRELIGTSVERVDAGSRLVGNAGESMREIVVSVQRVTDIIGEITAASNEQSGGIDQINTAVAQLDQMTQQNAALVEESAAAAESLKHQAVQLAEVVEVFRVDAASGARPSASRQATSTRAPGRTGNSGQKMVATIRPAHTSGLKADTGFRGTSPGKPVTAAPAPATRSAPSSPAPRANAARSLVTEVEDDGWESF